jgi:cytochrome c oxidase subunit 1
MTLSQMRIGMLGMRRRIADYDPTQGFMAPNDVITIAGFLIAISVLIFLINMFISARKGEIATGNLWESRSMEWQIPSPSPVHNYEHGLKIVGEPYDYGLAGTKYVEVPTGLEEGGG